VRPQQFLLQLPGTNSSNGLTCGLIACPPQLFGTNAQV
jgi:hypothetical protein